MKKRIAVEVRVAQQRLLLAARVAKYGPEVLRSELEREQNDSDLRDRISNVCECGQGLAHGQNLADAQGANASVESRKAKTARCA